MCVSRVRIPLAPLDPRLDDSHLRHESQRSGRSKVGILKSMIGILAILFFAASVIVHGGVASVSTPWLDWQGLALLGLLCLTLSFTPWRR